jgi:hypothetical protein
MSNDRNRDYYRRLDDARRLAQEEGRRVNRYFDEKIRKATIEGLKAKSRAEELTSEIERRKRSEEAKKLLEEICSDKASILKDISTCRSLFKKKWHACLSGIDLRSSSADAELKSLLTEVEAERWLWSDKPFELPAPPEWAKGLTIDLTSNQPGFTGRRRSSALISALELQFEQKERAKKIERDLNESSLASVAAALGALISRRNLYQSRAKV